MTTTARQVTPRPFGSRGPGGVRAADRLLTVEQAAEYMNTSVRFVRRLVAERRIAFVKLGRHVRISTSDLDAFVAAGRVEPVTLAWPGRRRVA
jgi:excisionase family DNA binding protein